jgi:hypothetical protein
LIQERYRFTQNWIIQVYLRSSSYKFQALYESKQEGQK